MEKFKFLDKNRLSQFPKNPGVYCFKKDKKILYIGKAANLRERVKNHFQQPSYRDYLFLDKVKKIGYIKTDSEIEALILEANLIKKYQPKYNVIWRDDKNYFFIAKTEEDFPRIFWTHQIKLKTKSSKLKAEYIGPFVDGKALKQTLKVLRKVFPYRSCRTLPKRPCLWYHLGRCLGPCTLKSTKIPLLHSSGSLVKISQRNAKNLMKIIQEGKNPALKELKREMKLASKNQEFEEAAKIRDQIMALERIMEHAKIFEPEIDAKLKPWQKFGVSWQKIERELRKILKTKNKISRIEAYDVSNIVGQAATGSMVTFVNGIPDKNFYRKFKIKIAGRPNDLNMLRECLNRRFKHKEWPYPDLILIDGGRAQLNASLKCLRFCLKQIKIIALAKRKNELFIESRKKPILLKNLPREIFNLILQLRDEAHRFARKYHHKLRDIDLFSES